MKKIILGAVIVFLTITATFSYMHYFLKIKKFNYSDKNLEIKSGKTLNNILNDLNIETDKIIKIYIKFKKYDSKIKAGYYEFDGEYTFYEIMEILIKGKSKIIKVTIPEGYTLKQIVERLESEKLIKQEKFFEILSKKEDFYFPVVNNNYEGYFYPDTYYFYQTEGEEKIINKILNRFLEKFPPDKYQDKSEFYKRLIMASIIEKEAYYDEERKIISSVFYNRIKKNMKLESCATVEYLFDYTKKRLTYNDLKIESEYNTYRNYGIPPHPISNPSEKSINAAFNPENTEYLYFVADKNRRHIFSKTYKEHLENKRRIK